jgi:hypothetical protein
LETFLHFADFSFSFASQAKNVRTEAVCNVVYSDEALMNKMQEEIDFLKAQLESKESIDRQMLEKDIDSKLKTFLTLSRPKSNRRQTWHHMPGGEFDPMILAPVNEANECNPSLDIRTPKILKPPTVTFPPTPDGKNELTRLFHLQEEQIELKQFTHLENHYKCTTKSDIINNLEKQLKMAQEQLQKQSNDQWNLVHEKLINELICSQCSEIRRRR